MFCSPTGRSIGFFAGGKLNKVNIEGGPPAALADCSPATRAAGGTWNRNGEILFTRERNDGLFRISENGGVAERVTALDLSREDTEHYSPHFLPDGDQFLFSVRSRVVANSGIYLGSLTRPMRKPLIQGASKGVYMSRKRKRVPICSRSTVKVLRLSLDNVWFISWAEMNGGQRVYWETVYPELFWGLNNSIHGNGLNGSGEDGK